MNEILFIIGGTFGMSLAIIALIITIKDPFHLFDDQVTNREKQI